MTKIKVVNDTYRLFSDGEPKTETVDSNHDSYFKIPGFFPKTQAEYCYIFRFEIFFSFFGGDPLFGGDLCIIHILVGD